MNTTAQAAITPDIAALIARRADFPILARKVHGRPLVYLDNAATTQKPQAVIDAVRSYYELHNSNIHRGVHTLSEEATERYEAARDAIQRFINARERSEVVFVRGATEGINLVAQSYARPLLAPGDEILISEMEHHANIVPWQMVCEQTGGVLKVISIDDAGALRMDEFRRLLGERTRLVAVGHVSNALGTINPIEEIIELAHAQGVPVLVDGAQAAPHSRLDMQALQCDFYVFSGHKMFAPTGIGVLYGRHALLEEMPPYQGGGDMIRMVSFEKTQYNDLPYKFEAGTPNIAGTVGLGAAVEYLEALDFDAVTAHEDALMAHAVALADGLPDLRIIGTAAHKAAVLSFVLDKIHPHDVGTVADHAGVAIRTGHHCAMPVMERYGVPATARASFAFYNTHADVDALFAALAEARSVFG